MNKDNPFFDNDELQPTAEILAAIDTEQSLELPMLDNFIPAGFPSPTQGIQSDGIDLITEELCRLRTLNWQFAGAGQQSDSFHNDSPEIPTPSSQS